MRAQGHDRPRSHERPVLSMHVERDQSADAAESLAAPTHPGLGRCAFWLAAVSAVVYVAVNQGLPNHVSFVLDAARKVVAAVSQ